MRKILSIIAFIIINGSLLKAETLYVEFSKDTVYFYNTNVWEQCAFSLDYTINIDNSNITITEIDTAEAMTTCYGYHNFCIPIVGLEYGTYHLELYRDCLYAEVRYIGSINFLYDLSYVKEHNYNIEKAVLYNTYPNPFNQTTQIKYSINKNTNVKLVLYNLCGVKIFELLNEHKNVGEHSFLLNSTNLSSGMYILVLETDTYLQKQKLVLIK